MDYFDEQNDKFYQFLNDTFEIRKHRKWEDIAKNITLLKVKLTYRYFSKLFPLNFDYLKELEKSKNEFSSIHYGTIKANKIIDEIVRFSLYSDKIIVFHPLQNPTVTNQKIDPRRNPKYWLPDFLDSLYFYIVIQKWVKSGIVKLIINPYEYNLELRDRIDKKVEQRLLRTNKNDFFDIGKSLVMENLAEQFAVIYKNKNKEFIIQSLLEMENPRFKESEAEEFANKIIEAVPRRNPLYDKLGINMGGSSMLVPTKGGGPLESIILVSETSGGNIYSPCETSWYQIKEFGLNDFWVKLNHLYSQIPLNFLNNIDTSFALELRLEDKLSGVRQELKKIYGELGNLDIKDFSESKVKLIQEGFIEEIKKSEAEWLSIKKQAELKRKYWLSANVGIPFMTTNEISFLPLALGSLAWLFMNEKSSAEQIKLHKLKNPISVYVDLKNKRENFMTELRNCII
jgi:hypothetical protein